MEEIIKTEQDENFESFEDEDIEFDEVDESGDRKKKKDADDDPDFQTELNLGDFFSKRSKSSGGEDDEKSLDSDDDLIDTRDPQALIRKLQSQRDKAINGNKTLKTQLKSSEGAVTFLSSFHSDPNFRMAVIQKYHPELIKPVNVGEFVKTKLAEEFKDFTYDPSKKDEIGSDHWAYAVRSQELLAEAQKMKSGANLKSLEDLEAEQNQKITQAKEKLDKQRKAAMKKYGLDVEAIKTFESTFLKKVSYLDLMAIYVNMMDSLDENGRSQIPSLRGGGKSNLNKRKSKGIELDDELFGANSVF